MKKGLIFGAILGGGFIAAVAGAALFQTSDLERIHAGIEAEYQRVEHLDAEQFATLDPQEFIVFDVREKDEFAVSHLPGAILVDPAISDAEFEALFADQLQGKRAIFYCSVGMRSSILADRIASFVEQSTGSPPANLTGGLFKWHNDERGLVSTSGRPTKAIHPFDDYWGRLIEDAEAISYSPVD